MGDIFSVRVAGNVVGTKSLASIEYGVAATGLKLVLVLGHTRCGAVTSSVELLSRRQDIDQATKGTHLSAIVNEDCQRGLSTRIVNEIEPSVQARDLDRFESLTADEKDEILNEVARRHVLRTVDQIIARSELIRNAVRDGNVMVVGALYDVSSGAIDFFTEPDNSMDTGSLTGGDTRKGASASGG